MNLGDTLQGLPAIQARQKIPPAKRRLQWLHSIVGGLIFIGGFFVPKLLGFPWQVGLAIAAFGGFITSKDLMLTFIKALAQGIAAIVGALGGKAPNGDAK